MSAERDRKTEILISNQEIEQRLNELSLDIIHDYKNNKLLLVGVLNGCFVTITALSQKLWRNGFTDFGVDFISLQTYDKDNQSSKNPKLLKDLKEDISNRHILIIEDIVDKGHSILAAQNVMKDKNPASIRTLALLSKKGTREVDVNVEYIGFEIENVWVEGFGLDSGEYGRGNPDIIKVFPPK